MKNLFKILLVCTMLLGCTISYGQEYAKNPVKKSKGVAKPAKKEEAKPAEKKPETTVAAPAAEDDEFMKLMKLAGSYSNKRKYADAVATYNKALEFKRKTGWVLRCRGAAYYDQKDYTNAIIDYTAAINAGSDYLGEIYYSRAMSKAKLDVPDKPGACADFAKAKELGFTVDGFDVELYCKG